MRSSARSSPTALVSKRLASPVLGLVLLIGPLAGLVVSGSPARAEDAADGRALLAPPGACAEPREALAGGGGSGFSVVGPVSTLFSPASVAAGPQPLQLAAPAPAAVVRPGPCDQPGAGCAPLATVTRTNPPLVPGPRPEPQPLISDPKHPRHPHPQHVGKAWHGQDGRGGERGEGG